MAAMDMASLKAYVQGGAPRQVGPSTLLLDITHNLLERRFVEIPFDLSTSIEDVKHKIYTMTGSGVEHMKVYLNGRIELKEEDNKRLGEYGARSGDVLHVEDLDPFSQARNRAFDDVSQVKKFELTEEQYDKRENTYRAYKKKMKEIDPNWKSLFEIKAEERRAARREALKGTDMEEKYETHHQIFSRIKVGMRCKVKPGDRRGEVKFIGAVPELPNYFVPTPEFLAQLKEEADAQAEAAANAAATTEAEANATSSSSSSSTTTTTTDSFPQLDPSICLWIGVALDEPLGKHDGVAAASGKRYFQCGYKCGVFAKPWLVETGDFPEVDPFASDNEEEDKDQEEKADIYEEL